MVFALVIRVLVKHSYRKLSEVEKQKKVIGTVKTLISIVSIMLMFGLQWLFGAFTISGASEAFQWLFVIFSTLQGFFLFLFFCVLSQDAREEWLNLFSFGRRKKKKRGAFNTNSSQSGHTRSTKSSTLYSKQNNTIKRNVLASTSSESSGVELKTRQRNLLMALPSMVSEEKDTEFIIENGNAAEHDHLANGVEVEKVDLAALEEEGVDKPPSVVIEVPAHILEGRFMLRYNPAAVTKIENGIIQSEEDDREFNRSTGEETDDEEEGGITDEEDEEGDQEISSEGSITCYDISTAMDYGGTDGLADLTQMTDITAGSSDLSDQEEISHL